MIDVLVWLAIIVLGTIVLVVVAIFGLVTWMIGYAIYAGVTGKPNPFKEHKQLFDSEEDPK